MSTPDAKGQDCETYECRLQSPAQLQTWPPAWPLGSVALHQIATLLPNFYISKQQTILVYLLRNHITIAQQNKLFSCLLSLNKLQIQVRFDSDVIESIMYR